MAEGRDPLHPRRSPLSYYHNSSFPAFWHKIHSHPLLSWYLPTFGRIMHIFAIVVLALRKESEFVLKIFVFHASRSELEISELSRRIFSITVISESWWILTRLPQWITMQWQKFYTPGSPHQHHDCQIQPMVSAYSLGWGMNYKRDWEWRRPLFPNIIHFHVTKI